MRHLRLTVLTLGALMLTPDLKAGVLSGGWICGTYLIGIDASLLPIEQLIQVENLIAFSPDPESASERLIPNFLNGKDLRLVRGGEGKVPSFAQLPEQYLLTVPRDFHPMKLSLPELMSAPMSQETREYWIYIKFDFIARAMVMATLDRPTKDEALRELMKTELGLQTDTALSERLEVPCENLLECQRAFVNVVSELTKTNFAAMLQQQSSQAIESQARTLSQLTAPAAPRRATSKAPKTVVTPRQGRRPTQDIVAKIETLFKDQNRLPKNASKFEGRLDDEMALYMFFYNRLRPIAKLEHPAKQAALDKVWNLFSDAQLREHARTEYAPLYENP